MKKITLHRVHRVTTFVQVKRTHKHLNGTRMENIRLSYVAEAALNVIKERGKIVIDPMARTGTHMGDERIGTYQLKEKGLVKLYGSEDGYETFVMA